MRRRSAGSGNRGGFTLVEILTVIALAALMVVTLQQALIGQRHFYEAQGAVSVRNESVRTALGVLGAVLREASVANGDIEILTPRRVRIRMPLGSGIVCGIDANGSRVGVVMTRGRWVERSGDSVSVQLTSGPYADYLDRVDPPSNRVPCLTASPGIIVRLDGRVPDIRIPSPARSFRSQLLESVVQGGAQYLYRVDGAERDLLVGPLDATDGFRAWYADLQGTQVASAALASRVVVQVIATAPDRRGVPSEIRDTVLMSFGGRN